MTDHALTLRQLIPVLSVVASGLSAFGFAPHIATMLRERTASGQSLTAWTLGLFTNGSLMLVDMVSYHAVILALGALVSFLGCVAAITLILAFRRSPSRADSASADHQSVVADMHADLVAEMHTGEFAVLHQAVIEEDRRRRERQFVAA